MKNFVFLTLVTFSGLTQAVGQTIPDGTVLNLARATQTLDIDANSINSGSFVLGEKPWWSNYQLAPQAFNAPGFSLSQGLPPNAAYRALNVASGQPYWSGYTGEYEAYPNQDMAVALASSRIPPPLATTAGGIDLTASRMSAAAASTLPANLAGRSFMSAAFNTYPYSQLYGYFEITARIPNGQAEFPAFWLVPENMNTGVDTEIDIMEAQGNDTSVYWTTLHSGDYTNNPALRSQSGHMVAAPEDLSHGYHRYGAEWGPSMITFYLDGVSVFSRPTPSDMHVPMYIIANLAIGGWLGGPTSMTPASATFSISSLRAWTLPSR